jgi:LuxR family maltose regulon positive regulatory protein
MPKLSLHVLTWSEEHQHYELHTQGHLQQCFDPDDEQRWQAWLSQRTSFAFQRQHRHVSIIKEARSRGAGYWYAYSTVHGRTRKRYLGQASSVTLKRLQQEALAFANENNATSQKKRQGIQAFSGTLQVADQGHVSPLGTKHTLPRLPSAFVRRERLLKELDVVLKHRLLLLSSSAGSGKTTLLSAWAAQSPHLVGWLSLDELDNDPIRFWASVITILRTCLPEISDITQSMYMHHNQYLFQPY